MPLINCEVYCLLWMSLNATSWHIFVEDQIGAIFMGVVANIGLKLYQWLTQYDVLQRHFSISFYDHVIFNFYYFIAFPIWEILLNIIIIMIIISYYFYKQFLYRITVSILYIVTDIRPAKKSGKESMDEEWDWGSTKMLRNFQNKTLITSETNKTFNQYDLEQGLKIKDTVCLNTKI